MEEELVAIPARALPMVAPGPAAVGRLVDGAPGTAQAVGPRPPLFLVQSRVERVRGRLDQRQVDGPDALVAAVAPPVTAAPEEPSLQPASARTTIAAAICFIM